MNGVYCQVSTMITVSAGKSVFHCTGSTPSAERPQLTMPTLASSMDHFQISAAAAGIMRNGVITRVRARPWPKNLRLSSRAMPRPKSTESTIDEPVITTVADSDCMNAPPVKTVT